MVGKTKAIKPKKMPPMAIKPEERHRIVIRSKKMPSTFAELERDFKLKPKHIEGAVGHYPSQRPHRTAVKNIVALAREYIGYFRKYPGRTHVFPMRGALLQYYFAKGVAAGAGLGVRVNKMTPNLLHEASYYTAHRPAEARKLRLNETGIVIHDDYTFGGVRSAIATAAGLKYKDDQVEVHNLNPLHTTHYEKMPVRGREIIFSLSDIVEKKLHGDQVVLGRPKDSHLNRRDVAFIRNALYAAGVVAGKKAAAQEGRK